MAKNLEEFLSSSLGTDRRFFTNLKHDGDWAFIIKIHAIIEAALNFAILNHFDDPRLEEVISRLDTSDNKKGKMAFIRALELLPKPMRSFIQILSEIRNDIVHDVRNLGFNLISWIEENMSIEARRNLRTNLTAMYGNADFKFYGKKMSMKDFAQNHPRLAITMAVYAIVFEVYLNGQKKKGLSHDEEQFELKIGAKIELPKSTPKKSK